jgi:nucleoside phosphorylase
MTNDECRMAGGSVLVCFAVKDEAGPFRGAIAGRPGIHVLVTGIGRKNSEHAVLNALRGVTTELVLTCGFAGGLNSELTTGTVIFSADEDSGLTSSLLAAGAHPVLFHCAQQVATTAAHKKALRESTGADAVEMESEVIRALCRERRIPSATVRVISDAAHEDLPLDFNALMNDRQELQYGRLAISLARSPGKIPALLRLQRQTQSAARNLAAVLGKIIPD